MGTISFYHGSEFLSCDDVFTVELPIIIHYYENNS